MLPRIVLGAALLLGAGSVAQGSTSDLPFLPSDEFLLDTSRVLLPATGRQSGAYAASNGTDYLVLWNDQRQGRNTIFGSRVRQDGTVLDSASFHVLEDFGEGAPASVAYGRGCYLTVGIRVENWYPWYPYYHLVGARVMADGSAPDVGGFRLTVSDPLPLDFPPLVCFQDTAFLVTWKPRGLPVKGVFVWPSGRSGSSFTVASLGGLTSYSMASGGGTFLLVYQRETAQDEIMGLRLNGEGAVIDSTPFVISDASGDLGAPSVAYDGVNFAVAWARVRSGTDSSGIYACRVSLAGDILDSSGIRVSFDARDSAPTVVSTSQKTLIGWYHATDSLLMGARVSFDGALLDTQPIQICRFPSIQKDVRIAAGSAGFMPVWSDARGNAGEVFCNIVDTAGSTQSPDGIMVTWSANPQSSPAIAGNHLGYFAVWRDNVSGDIRGTRISPFGNILDMPALHLASAPSSQSHPAVTALGSDSGFLAVWEDARPSPPGIYGVRVTADGRILDPEGIRLSPFSESVLSAPAVTWNPTRSGSRTKAHALVVWRYRGGVFGARVAASGRVLDPDGICISAGPVGTDPPAVASDGDNSLVAWSMSDDIYGARVTADGSVLDILPLQLATWDWWQRQPYLAYGDGHFGLVEQDGCNSYQIEHNTYYAYDAYFVQILPSGQVQDTTALQTDRNVQENPVIAHDGASFVTAWSTSGNTGSNLQGAWLDPSGHPATQLPPITSDFGDQRTPRLAHGPGYQVLLVYDGWAGVVDGAQYGTQRIWGKLLDRTGIAEEPGSGAERILNWARVSPNPARGRVLIRYALTKVAPIQLSITDCSGRIVHRVRCAASDGRGEFEWGGISDDGQPLANGVYFCTLRAGKNEEASCRIVLLN